MRLRARFIELLLALVLLAMFVPIEPGPLKYHVWTLFVGFLGLAAVLAGRVALPGVPLAKLGALWLGWVSLTVIWAPYTHAALESALWIATLLIIFLVVSAHRSESHWMLTHAVCLAGLCISVYAHLQSADLIAHAHWSNPVRNSGPYANSNLFAAYLNMTLFVAIGLISSATTWLQRLLGAMTAASCLGALLLTGSRGAWLAAAGGLCVFVLLSAGGSKAHARYVPHTLLLGAILVGFGLYTSGKLHGVMERLQNAGDYSVHHRLSMYRDTLSMIRHQPLGSGLGNYETVFPRYRTFSDRFRVNFAHSEPLEATAQLGLPGFVLLGLWFGVAAATAYRRIRTLSTERVLNTGFAAALASLAIQSLYGFPLRTVAVGVLGVVLLAVLCVPSKPQTPGRRLRWLTSTLTVLLIVTASVLGWSERLGQKAQAAASELKLNASIEHYKRAAAWSLGNAEFYRALANQYVRRVQLPIVGETFFQLAHASYSQATQHNPYDAGSHLGLAVLARAHNETSTAKRHYLAAIDCDPSYGGYYQYAGEFLLDQGQTTEAIELMGKSLALFPAWVDAEYFARSARAANLSNEVVGEFVAPRPVAIRQAIPALVAHGYQKAAESLITHPRAKLTEQDFVSIITTLETRQLKSAQAVWLELALTHWPESPALLALGSEPLP